MEMIYDLVGIAVAIERGFAGTFGHLIILAWAVSRLAPGLVTFARPHIHILPGRSGD